MNDSGPPDPRPGPHFQDRRGIGYVRDLRTGSILLRYPKWPKGKAAVKKHKRERQKAHRAQRVQEAITEQAMRGPE